ncbi:MAG TPA: DoxX family protein [Candidatus Acidoferrales bacterium]|nr:DoxX family protein [Candidatus Acidoferrales bacterium]
MKTLEQLKPLGLLFLRVALGVIFIYHGYPKLFSGTQQMMGFFKHIGLPGYFVFVAGVLEFFGGILLIIGLFTRLAGLLLTCEMLVALWKAHGLFSHPAAVDNYQFPLACCAGAFALATIGAGIISLDQILFRERGKSSRKSKD